MPVLFDSSQNYQIGKLKQLLDWDLGHSIRQIKDSLKLILILLKLTLYFERTFWDSSKTCFGHLNETT